MSQNKDEAVMQEKGFMFKGEFSASYDLDIMKSNMQRRLAFIRGLKPEQESAFNAWEIARQQLIQRQK